MIISYKNAKLMLKKTYDALVKQLQTNMDCQDFYSDSYTDLWIDGKVVSNIHPFIEFRHPLFILNGNQENVFPEKAQLDVDKEFEPAIAMVLAFGMKENKQELERFKSLYDFGEFREIKDYGIRFYAMDFGTDVNAAATKCVDIIKKVFDGEKAQSIQISTCNGLGEEISTETVSQQKREKALNNIAAKPMVTQTAKSIVCPHCGSKLFLSKELEDTYYLRCNICQGEFANPLKPIGKSENWLRKNGAKWGCLIIVVLLALATLFAPKDFTSGTGGVGDNIVLTKETFGAIDEKAFDELNDVMVAKDNIGLLQLMYDGRVENLKSGTKGLVLKRSMWKTRIRLNNGKTYWVNTDYIQSTTK